MSPRPDHHDQTPTDRADRSSTKAIAADKARVSMPAAALIAIVCTVASAALTGAATWYGLRDEIAAAHAASQRESADRAAAVAAEAAARSAADDLMRQRLDAVERWQQRVDGKLDQILDRLPTRP